MSPIDRDTARVASPSARAEPRAQEPAGGMLGVIRRVGGSLLARPRTDGFERTADVLPLQPLARVEGTGGLTAQLARARSDVPSAERLLEQLDTLYPRPLSAEQEDAIRELKPDGRRQMLATLRALTDLKERRQSGAQYMVRVMQAAATISGADRQVFLSLVRMALGAERDRRSPEGAASEALDRTFHALRGGPSTHLYGFHPALHDGQGPRGIPQKLAEALGPERSLRRWTLHGQRLTGDLRCARFGRMLARGLREGRLSPVEAVELTRWAFTEPKHDEAPAPWERLGSFRLDAWLQAFQAAQPVLP